MTDLLPADRWLEMDLTWFDPVGNPAGDLTAQIDMLLQRVTPLLTVVSGEQGIVFNVGWLIDLVTEWTGDPDQRLPLQSRRTAKWAQQSYAFLRDFLAQLRAEAARHDLPRLKLGVLFVGWSHVVWPPELKIYDFDSAWYARHPEVYSAPKTIIGMPDLHPVQRLNGDDYPYAAFPNGLTAGAYFPEFFGAQWGHLSRFLGLDLLLLRDGLTGPMVYTRNGPYGTRAPSDPAVVAAFSQSVRDLYRCVKEANPAALVFGYSSAISPVADWRVGCVDFEALVADGYIDGWIEQTWGGAWQDWWHQLWKGWTFQTANLLTRGVMIARANEQRATPCRFYNLIETWDGWEPWDTLHQVPHKLRWAMWAFTHAAALTPQGVKVPDGSYISWMNNGAMALLSEDDVAYLNTHLNAAQADALAMDRVYGCTLVYHRAMMEWLSAEHPDWNVSEWIDDYAALLMKWGVPALGCTRSEWLAQLPPPRDGWIAQTPGLLDRAVLETLLDDDTPLLVVGRADVLDSTVQAALGIFTRGEAVEAGFQVARGAGAPPYDRPYLPEHAVIGATADTEVLYETPATPLMTRCRSAAYWQPPDWSEPFNAFVPKYQLGSTFPHYRAAVLLHEMARAHGLSHLEGVEHAQPLAFHLWRSAGRVTVLLGNLETGVFGDARTPRSARLWLNREQLALGSARYTLERIDGDENDAITLLRNEGEWLVFEVVIPPEDCRVLRLREVEANSIGV